MVKEVESEFRMVYLPYCLQRQKDGTWLALNRRYKPVGITRTDFVDYEAYPVRFTFKRALSEAQIAALDCKGRIDADCIYLYSDGSVPTDSPAKWAAYAERLARLAGYKIEH